MSLVETKRQKLPARGLPRFLHETDSPAVRRLQRLYKALREDTCADSVQKDMMVRRAAFLSVEIEKMEIAALTGGEFLGNQYSVMVNSLVSILKQLGLERQSVDALNFGYVSEGTQLMDIVSAVKDELLFRPFIQNREGNIVSWHNWLAALRCLYGLSVPYAMHETVQQCTGRDPDLLPEAGFNTGLFLVGRRAGKSRIAAIIGAYEAGLAGHENRLAPGEKGVVAILAPTTKQAHIIRNYLRQSFDGPLLRPEVLGDTTSGGFSLRNGISVEVLSSDYRSVRGHTLVAALVDECCFFASEEGKIRADTAIINALKPALATTGGKLIALSSPFARTGWGYRQWQSNFGNERGKTLVWVAPSTTMNPTLPQTVVDEALAEDYPTAASEYLAQWRDDVGLFLSRAEVERLVVAGRRELLPRREYTYSAFADLSGGRADDAALCIGHRERETVVVDLLRQYKPPFDPYRVIAQMAHECCRFRVPSVSGDSFADEFTVAAFRGHGLPYLRCDQARSGLYQAALPTINAAKLELPDNAALVNQFAQLERRTAGGRELIDHKKPNGHDDLCLVVAGLCYLLANPVKTSRIGALPRSSFAV